MNRKLVCGVLSVLLSWLPLAGPGIAQVTVEARLAPGQPPVIGPFRGVGEGFPESSLAGMAAALDLGADIIDIQVQITADGHHVVFHDQFLNRITDVEAVFETGPAGGPTRQARAGRDYMSDYTLTELRALHLLMDGAPTVEGIPTLAEALDLVGQRALVLLTLNTFDLDTLVAELAARDTAQMLLYNADPAVLRQVVEVTGIPAFASIRRSRVFDTSDTIAILDASHGILGEHLLVAHVNSTRLVTPELVARAEELGVLISTSGGRENFALEEGDTMPWREAFDCGATLFWTPYPEKVLALLEH